MMGVELQIIADKGNIHTKMMMGGRTLNYSARGKYSHNTENQVDMGSKTPNCHAQSNKDMAQNTIITSSSDKNDFDDQEVYLSCNHQKILVGIRNNSKCTFCNNCRLTFKKKFERAVQNIIFQKFIYFFK
jgi:hypothetical protein